MFVQLKNWFYTHIMRRPFVDVSISVVDGRAVINCTYNKFFLDELDDLGYDSYDDPEDKIDAYMASVWTSQDGRKSTSIGDVEPLSEEYLSSGQWLIDGVGKIPTLRGNL